MMPELAEKIFASLKERWNCYFDDKGAVGIEDVGLFLHGRRV
jgi:hypothetical protein